MQIVLNEDRTSEKKWLVNNKPWSCSVEEINRRLAGYDRLLKERNKLDVQLVAANENIEKLLKELRKVDRRGYTQSTNK